MSKKQIRKDFEELYIGQNTNELINQYYCKKKKELLFIFLIGLSLILLLFYKEHQESKLSKENILYRNEKGAGKKEIPLEVKIKEGKWEKFHLELEEKEYEEYELEKMHEEVTQMLTTEILGENNSITQISKNLNLMQEIEGYPFIMIWESSKPEIVDSMGNVSTKGLSVKGEEIELKVKIIYKEWEKEHIVLLDVYPEKQNSFMAGLKEKIEKTESENRKKREFYLPDTFQENTLQWRYAKENTAIILGVIFLMILPVIDYQKDQEIHKQAQKRREKLQKEYPEFINKLILYMEAGMNVKAAIFKIAQGYQKKEDRRISYLYEELLYVCRQNKNGLSEEDTYILFGERCNLPCYKKLTGLLIQHLQKGSYGILEALRAEVNRANDERRKQIKKQGEEMGTKLLFPMILMLLVVMVLIMIPACFSFQI